MSETRSEVKAVQRFVDFRNRIYFVRTVLFPSEYFEVCCSCGDEVKILSDDLLCESCHEREVVCANH